MLEQKLPDFINYFREIQQKHKLLQDFVHGPVSRVLGQSRSDLKYPCLWLETPNLVPKDNGADHITGIRNSAFIVMVNTPQGDTAAEDQTWFDTERIALQVLSRMKKDKKARLIDFDISSVRIDAISTLGVDNDYGWRVEFTYGTDLNLCFNPDDWNE